MQQRLRCSARRREVHAEEGADPAKMARNVARRDRSNREVQRAPDHFAISRVGTPRPTWSARSMRSSSSDSRTAELTARRASSNAAANYRFRFASQYPEPTCWIKQGAFRDRELLPRSVDSIDFQRGNVSAHLRSGDADHAASPCCGCAARARLVTERLLG